MDPARSSATDTVAAIVIAAGIVAGAARGAAPPRPLVAAAALALALAGAVHAVRRKLDAPHQARTVAWARRRDVRDLVVERPGSGRLTLGRLRAIGRPLLASDPLASLAVIGPSQSGKTSGLAIPAILEWAGPVVATSVKTDLAASTVAARSAGGPVWVFDPTRSTGLVTSSWSPLGRCGNWAGARQTASWLCNAGRARVGGDEDFWYAAAGKLLAPYLLAARLTGRTMTDVVAWIDVQEEDEVADTLDRAGAADALRAATASWARDERTRSSIYATAEIALEAYADPIVAASANQCDLTAEELLASEHGTLFVCAPSHEQQRLRPLFTTLLQQVVRAAYERQAPERAAPLLVVLDEAANIAPLDDLDTLASTAAGCGIQLVTVWQDMAQLNSRYGERGTTILNNHRSKLILSGVSDAPTLEYGSRLLGETLVADASRTTDDRGGRSTTTSTRERKVLTEAELRRVRPGEGVLIHGHLPPARITLRPWFRDRHLRRLASS